MVNWENSGAEIKAIPHSVVANEKLYLRDGITWATVSSSKFGFRRFGNGFIFDNKGACLFLAEDLIEYVLAILNSDICRTLLIDITPSVSLQPGDVGRMPIIEPKEQSVKNEIIENVRLCIAHAQTLWDAQEISWDFKMFPVVQDRVSQTVAAAVASTKERMESSLRQIRDAENRNSQLLREVYQIGSEPVASDAACTWFTSSEIVINLLSYVMGCAMGRYSLDRTGLVYAYGGNEGFAPDEYKTFRADDDGIIPLLEADWVCKMMQRIVSLNCGRSLG